VAVSPGLYANTNTYSGGTFLNDGRIVVVNNAALSNGGVTISGGTLTNSGNRTLTNAITASGGTITAAEGTDFTINSAVTGSGNVEVAGVLNQSAVLFGGDNSGFAGTITVTGANTRLNTATAASAAATWVVDGNLQLNRAGMTTYEFGELSSTASTGGISGHAANGSPTTSTLRLLSFADIGNQKGQFVQDTTVFALINYTGTWDGGVFTIGSTPLADGDRFFVDSQLWEIDYDYQVGGSNIQPLNFIGSQVAGSFVTVTAVPEPSTYVMLAIAGGIAAVAARRRRKA